MAMRGCSATARQDEFFKWRQIGVETIYGCLDAGCGLCCNHLVAGNTKLTTEIKQVVLHLDEHLCNSFWNRLAQHYTNDTIELVNGPEGFNPQIIFADALSIAKSG
jgi:uncharacterized cysteine cluster protein YcgN (CxxCxxCC family)